MNVEPSGVPDSTARCGVRMSPGRRATFLVFAFVVLAMVGPWSGKASAQGSGGSSGGSSGSSGSAGPGPGGGDSPGRGDLSTPPGGFQPSVTTEWTGDASSALSQEETDRLRKMVRRIQAEDAVPIGTDLSPFWLQSPVSTVTLRYDSQGDGTYGSGRGNRQHRGVDVEASPGASVSSPVSGTIAKVGDVYGDGRYRTVWIETEEGYRVGLYYVSPSVKVGDRVKTGQAIGTAQDRAAESRGMKNHIHMEIRSPRGVAVNPTQSVGVMDPRRAVGLPGAPK